MTTVIANGHANGVVKGPETDAKEPSVQIAAVEAAEAGAPNGTTLKSSSYPKSRLSLVDRFIDEPRSLRVGVIGGGLAGILAGILFPAKVPNINLTIYEKNHDFVSYFPPVFFFLFSFFFFFFFYFFIFFFFFKLYYY